MICRHNQSKLVELLLNELNGEEENIISQQIKGCICCQAKYEKLGGVVNDLYQDKKRSIDMPNEETFIYELDVRIDNENNKKHHVMWINRQVGAFIASVFLIVLLLNMVNHSSNKNRKRASRNSHKSITQAIYQSTKKPKGLKMSVKRPAVDLPKTNRVSISKMPSFPSKPKYKMRKTKLQFKIGT